MPVDCAPGRVLQRPNQDSPWLLDVVPVVGGLLSLT